MKAKRNLMIGLVVLLVVLAVGVLADQTISDRDAAVSASEDTSIALTSLTASSEIESFGYTWQGDTLNFEQRQEVVETESDSSETADDSASTSASQESEPETETVWYLADDPEYAKCRERLWTLLISHVKKTAPQVLRPDSGTDTSDAFISIPAPRFPGDMPGRWLGFHYHDYTVDTFH